jgi:hypothetical protein
MTLKADAVLVNILAKGIQGFTKAIGIAVALSPSRGASSGIGSLCRVRENSLAQIKPNAGKWFQQVNFN